jgi:hypothetical protein
MAIVNKIFWVIAALEAAFFVVAFVMTLNASGHADGGKEMSLIFQIGLPFLVLGIVSLIYWKTNSPTLHIILLIAMTAPLALLANQWITHFTDPRKFATGSGIFDDRTLSKLLAAIYDLDTKKVRELASRVDINAVGDGELAGSIGSGDVTPLGFAAQKLGRAGETAGQTAARVEMMKLLLSLGARPGPALKYACASANADAVGLLLDAGADPNLLVAQFEKKQPVFYSCLSSIENLRLLASKGGKFDLPSADGTAAIQTATMFGNWDAALFFLDHGANLEAVSPDGRTVRSHVEEETDKFIGYYKNEKIPDNLQQFAAKLKQARLKQ